MPRKIRRIIPEAELPVLAGRPSHKPTEATRAKVETMAMMGGTLAQIAAALNLSTATIKKYYGAELELGADKGDMKLKETIWHVAHKARNVQMLLHLAKTRLGMSEKQTLDVNVSRNADDLTDEELLAIARKGRDQIGPDDDLADYEPDGPGH